MGDMGDVSVPWTIGCDEWPQEGAGSNPPPSPVGPASIPPGWAQSEEGQAWRDDGGWHPCQGPGLTLTPRLLSVPQNNEKLQESPCIFALTPRQVELIRNSRCAVPATRQPGEPSPGRVTPTTRSQHL